MDCPSFAGTGCDHSNHLKTHAQFTKYLTFIEENLGADLRLAQLAELTDHGGCVLNGVLPETPG